MKILSPLYFLCFILLFISSCSFMAKPGDQVRRAPVEYGRTVPQEIVQAATQPGVAPRPDARYKIALLVPLTGKSSKIGKSLSEAAQMAVFESNNPEYQVIPFDTGDSNEGATNAAKQAVAAGANIILGPVFGDKVAGVASVASQAGLKVVSFSNNKAVAGDNVYILGLITNQQVKRVVGYASDRGIRGYSAILPGNILGKQVEESINAEVKSAGGEVRKIGIYAGTDYLQPTKELADEFTAKSIVPDKKGEAVLVLEGAKAEKIASALIGSGLGSLRMLGTSLWDNYETVSNSALESAWYASIPHDDIVAFNSRFEASFGYEPVDIASLAYDAVLLAIETAPSNFSDNELRRGYGFRGINGHYKFDRNGVNHRGYAVYEIKNGGAVLVDSPPSNF